MQIDIAPSELPYIEGLLMNQLHPIAAMLNGKEATQKFIDILHKLNVADTAADN